MSLSDHHSTWLYEKEAKDRIKIIRDLKKGRYASALKTLSHYSKLKTSSANNREELIGEYFVWIHSAYAYFGLNQYPQAKECLEKILYRHPLDGPANLLIAYLNLLEGHKPEAIHGYSILLNNPFYCSQAVKILDRIRGSENLPNLLSQNSIDFFYRHPFPDIFWEQFWDGWNRFFMSLKALGVKTVSMVQAPQRSKSLKKNISPTSKKKGAWMGLSILLLIGVGGILFFKSQGRIGFQNDDDTSKENQEIFSEVIMNQYGEEAVKWVKQYRELEKMIDLREFNLALELYRTFVKNQDLPIEVENKFYILSTFITSPHFDDLDPTTSFIDIDKEKLDQAIGLYYKLEFKVLQVNLSRPTQYRIELVNYSRPPGSSQASLDFFANKAILIFHDNTSPGLKVKGVYESIAQLDSHKNKYLVFTSLVLRPSVRMIRE